MGLGNIIANTANFQEILIIPPYSSYQQLYIAEAMHAVAFNIDETGTVGSSSNNSKGSVAKNWKTLSCDIQFFLILFIV